MQHPRNAEKWHFLGKKSQKRPTMEITPSRVLVSVGQRKGNKEEKLQARPFHNKYEDT